MAPLAVFLGAIPDSLQTYDPLLGGGDHIWSQEFVLCLLNTKQMTLFTIFSLPDLLHFFF